VIDYANLWLAIFLAKKSELAEFFSPKNQAYLIFHQKIRVGMLLNVKFRCIYSNQIKSSLFLSLYLKMYKWT